MVLLQGSFAAPKLQLLAPFMQLPMAQLLGSHSRREAPKGIAQKGQAIGRIDKRSRDVF